MLVSISHRLVILAMPKCASTSLETALAGRMDLVFRGRPQVKHTPFRKYDRFVRPYLESIADGPYEVVSLIREPVDWLGSWWRYRARPGAPGRNSTAGLGFAAFAAAYLDGQRTPADVGSQARFVSRPDGGLGVDRLFRHDRLGDFVAYLEGRLGGAIALGHENRSPEGQLPALQDDLAARLRTGLAAEYALYDAAGQAAAG